MQKIETVISGESYTYAILWSCCKRQLAIAKETNSGNLYFLLTAMSMAYFTYEAYLNHALHKVAPDIYEQERTYFAGPVYRGTSGKLKKLCELACLTFPDKSTRPYQNIRMLEKLRNSVAHGKPYTFETKVKHRPEDNPSSISSYYDDVVTESNAINCINDLEEFIKWLNSELINNFGSNGLLRNPLNGLLGHSDSDFI